MNKNFFAFVLAGACWSTLSLAAIKTETVAYTQGDQALEGIVSYDTSKTGKRPGVLVIHDWMGVGEYTKFRTEMLAKLGYVALGADIYGKGVRPTNPKDAGAQAGKFKSDRALLRARIQAGLAELRKNKNVDPKRVVAIGYCFGGTSVLELARAGADVRGVVSFHGGLDNPKPETNAAISTKVLVLHGADDPYVPEAELKGFEDEMRKAKVDYQVVKYSGAVHSFTRADSGTDPAKGAAYHEPSDRRSWIAMKDFFAEVLK